MSDLEVSPESLPINVGKMLEDIESVGVLALKGYRDSEICEVTGLSRKVVRDYRTEYYSLLQGQADSDPHFLERIGLNTVKSLKELDEINKEAWETVQIATDNGMVTARVQALKLALEISTKKAQLHQLLTASAKTSDSGYLERLQRAETVNNILSSVIREVVADCEHCRERTRMSLAQAFSMMQSEEADVDDADFEDGVED